MLSAYVVREVLDAFATPALLTPTERDQVQTAFLERLPGMIGLLEAPSHQDVVAKLVEERRRAPEIRLLAQVLDIQPKDVPIVVLAYRYADYEPTILTNDRAFATFAPTAHDLRRISIEHVDSSGE